MLSQLLCLVAFIHAAATMVGAQELLQNDGWHFDQMSVLVNEQFDPIIYPNSQSVHMHKTLGKSLVVYFLPQFFQTRADMSDASIGSCLMTLLPILL